MMKQDRISPQSEGSISYTRLIDIEEQEDERQQKKELQEKQLINNQVCLDLALNPPGFQLISDPSKRGLLNTIITSDGPNIEIHYLSLERDPTSQERQLNSEKRGVPTNVKEKQCLKSDFFQKINSSPLKPIQENQMEYKRSDCSQVSMLESKIVNHIVIDNIARRLPGFTQLCSQAPGSRGLDTTIMKKSNKSLFGSLALEQVYIRPINDSIEANLEDLLAGREEEEDADKITLRLVAGPDAKSALLSQSPQGRGILSSLITSKNQKNQMPRQTRNRDIVRKIPEQEVVEDKKKSSSLRKLILLKLNSIERLIQERKLSRGTQKKRSKALIHSQGLETTSRSYFMNIPLNCLSLRKLSTFLREGWDGNLEKITNSLPLLLRELKIRQCSYEVVHRGTQQLIIVLPETNVLLIVKPSYIFIGAGKEGFQTVKMKGLEVQSNRYLYRGFFRNNLKEGFGEIVYADSSTYSGEWAQDKFQGQGIFKSKEGETYQGTFSNFQKSGLGTELFTNGDSYTGNYQRNLFHNYGIYTWKNGSVYQGQFLEGNMHGKGHWVSSNGDQYVGQYFRGVKQGQGTYLWSNGKIYEGPFRRGRRIRHSSRQGKGKLSEFHSVRCASNMDKLRFKKMTLTGQKRPEIKIMNSIDLRLRVHRQDNQ